MIKGTVNKPEQPIIVVAQTEEYIVQFQTINKLFQY
jgi:hypothetical protein